MSILDSITIFDWDGPSFGIGRRGRKLLARGEQATATIVGIKVTRTANGDDAGSNSKHYAYALDVQQGKGAPVRMGCRQYFSPERRRVGLGSQVVVRHRKGRVIIDWRGTLAGLGSDNARLGDSTEWWKPLKDPPAPGIEDHEQNGNRKRIAAGQAAHATVLKINALEGLFGSIENVDVDVELAYPDGTKAPGLLRKVIAPDYAHHLLRPGAVLPVGVDKGGSRITVDWVAACNSAAR
jgi:hypothetical protein